MDHQLENTTQIINEKNQIQNSDLKIEEVKNSDDPKIDLNQEINNQDNKKTLDDENNNLQKTQEVEKQNCQSNQYENISAESDSSEDEKEEELTEEQMKHMEEEKNIINQQLKNEGMESMKEKEELKKEIEQCFQPIEHQCEVCQKQGELLRCSRCKQVYYCTQDCQRKDWSTHKTICKSPQQEENVLANQQAQAIPPQKRGKSLDDFKDLKFVGQGNFSEIFSAIEIKDGRKYAIKKISKRRLSQVNKEKDIIMEKHCLSRLLDNPYVARLYCTFQDDDHLYIQTEIVEGGELWHEIHIFGAITQSLIKYYFSQILLGKSLKILFYEPYRVYMKLEQCTEISKPNKNIKFIDFGTARDMKNLDIQGSGNGLKGKRVYEHFVGTPQFMAPECIRNKDSTFKSDIYSLGCLFYQLICGQTPYAGKTDYLVFTAALETEIKFPALWPFSEEQKELILMMTEKQLANRCSLEQVKAHRYWGEEWDWANVADYQTALSQASEEEQFLLETRNKLREVEKEESKDLKEFAMNEILKAQKSNPLSANAKFLYVEKLAREFLPKEDEEHGFQ